MVTTTELVTFVCFFLTMSIALPVFLLPFSSAMLQRLQSQLTKVTAELAYVEKAHGKADDLADRLDTAKALVSDYVAVTRFSLVALLVVSIGSLFTGLWSIQTEGPYMFHLLSKSELLVALLSVQFLVFVVNMVTTGLIDPARALDSLRLELIRRFPEAFGPFTGATEDKEV